MLVETGLSDRCRHFRIRTASTSDTRAQRWDWRSAARTPSHVELCRRSPICRWLPFHFGMTDPASNCVDRICAGNILKQAAVG